MKRFFVITNERSGSKFLIRYLNEHPNIKAIQEVAIDPFLVDFKKFDDLIFRKFNKSIFILKVMYRQIDDRMIEYIQSRNIKTIQLIRRDLLETLLWYKHLGKAYIKEIDLIGGLGKAWELKDKKKLHVEVNEMTHDLKKLKVDIDYWFNKADFKIAYEDFSDNKNIKSINDKKIRRALFDFIGVYDIDIKIRNFQDKNIRDNYEFVNMGELINKLKDENIETYFKKTIEYK